jgi:hypothetical protein
MPPANVAATLQIRLSTLAKIPTQTREAILFNQARKMIETALPITSPKKLFDSVSGSPGTGDGCSVHRGNGGVGALGSADDQYRICAVVTAALAFDHPRRYYPMPFAACVLLSVISYLHKTANDFLRLIAEFYPYGIKRTQPLLIVARMRLRSVRGEKNVRARLHQVLFHCWPREGN